MFIVSLSLNYRLLLSSWMNGIKIQFIVETNITDRNMEKMRCNS